MTRPMEEFDFDYFLILEPRQDDDKDHDLIPALTPDDDTASLPFRYKAIPFGSKPLVFVNGFKERQARLKQTSIRIPPPILFEGANPVVHTPIRDKLLQFNIPNLEIQPAIFIDDWDKWHEDYWYLTFTEEFDCWSRKRSDYERGHGIDLGGGEVLRTIHELRLDNDKLRKVPLEERLLFQLGGATDAFVLAHTSIAHLFDGHGKSGAQVLSLQDYPDKW
ncbi:hypothetical protein DZC73_12915 [Albitalea terrae]|uniref:Uncharacterized protein n=2 Tax=Piscinibacter terrae TaxID=2496871 RepID=A0A3N7HR73_9BURK|nr:hypothetical protein DZC73_12915 [Albitalea terrae]